MRIWAVFIGFLMLSGCATDEPPVTYQQPSPPPKPPLYRKDGASTEEFQRTKAGCLVKAQIAESSSTDPEPLVKMVTYMSVFRNCMRAEGWVLTRQ
jgi:hypothetical protein